MGAWYQSDTGLRPANLPRPLRDSETHGWAPDIKHRRVPPTGRLNLRTALLPASANDLSDPASMDLHDNGGALIQHVDLKHEAT